MAFSSGFPKEFEPIHVMHTYEDVDVIMSTSTTPLKTKIESNGPMWQIMVPETNQIYCVLFLPNYNLTIGSDDDGEFIRCEFLFDNKIIHKFKFKKALEMYQACKDANDNVTDLQQFSKLFNCRRINLLFKGVIFYEQASHLEQCEFEMKFNTDTNSVAVKLSKLIGEVKKAVFLTNIKDTTILHYGFDIPKMINERFLPKVLLIYNSNMPNKKFYFVCGSYPDSMSIMLNYFMSYIQANGKQPDVKKIIIPQEVINAAIGGEDTDKHHKHRHRTQSEKEAHKKQKEEKRKKEEQGFNLLPAEPDKTDHKNVMASLPPTSLPPGFKPPPPPSVRPPPPSTPPPPLEESMQHMSPISPPRYNHDSENKISQSEVKKEEEVKKPQISVNVKKEEEQKKKIEENEIKSQISVKETKENETKKTTEVKKEEETKKPQLNVEVKKSDEIKPQENEIKKQEEVKKPELNVEVKKEEEIKKPQLNVEIKKEEEVKKPQLNVQVKKEEETKKPETNTKPQLNVEVKSEVKKGPKLAFTISSSSDQLVNNKQEGNNDDKGFILPESARGRVSVSRRYKEQQEEKRANATATRRSTVNHSVNAVDISFLKKKEEPILQPVKVERPKLLPAKFEEFSNKYSKQREVKVPVLSTVESLSTGDDIKKNETKDIDIKSILEKHMDESNSYNPFSDLLQFTDIKTDELVEATIEKTTCATDLSLFSEISPEIFNEVTDDDFKYAAQPQSPFLAEVMAVNEGIISSGASRIIDSNSERLQFVIATIFMNGFKGAYDLTSQSNFLDAYMELAEFVPIIKECVESAKKGVDFGQQVSLFTQSLLNNYCFIRTARTAMWQKKWSMKYYTAAALIRNYSELDMILSIFAQLLLTHEVEISYNPLLLSNQQSTEIQRFAFMQSCPHILVEEFANGAGFSSEGLLQLMKYIFYNGFNPVQTGIAVNLTLQRKDVKKFMEQVAYADRSGDEDFPEFQKVVQNSEKIVNVFEYGMKTKKLHKFFAYAVLSRSIVDKYYFPEAAISDFYKAKKIYTVLKHIDSRQ